MRIVLPVVDLEENKNLIFGGLNATGQICIYDTITEEFLWIKISNLAENLGELLPALEKQEIAVIITSKIQPMALKILVNKGFEVYKSEGDEVKENILHFNKKRLTIFDMESALSDSLLCGGSCAVCSTDCQETPEMETNTKQQAS